MGGGSAFLFDVCGRSGADHPEWVEVRPARPALMPVMVLHARLGPDVRLVASRLGPMRT